MSPKQNNTPKTSLESELDKLGDMMDAALAKGDDEFYEAFKSKRDQTNSEDAVKRPRRKGRTM